MKDKNLAAILAFFGGMFGLHRFYLGQIGLGVFYCIIFPIAAMIGVLDAIIFLAMSEESFDDKYNRDMAGRPQRGADAYTRPSDRYERYRQREAQRRAGARTASNQSNSSRNRSVSNRGLSSKKAPIANKRGNANREEGIRYYKDYEYERAIKAFELSLREEPTDIATHWNIACCYSLTEDADKAMYHLDRAVALGFDDFERIREHDALAYLRVQPAYLNFAKNDFRLSPLTQPTSATKVQGDALSPVDSNKPAARENADLLEQLSRLGELREKGLLTEAEFANQKRKLLG